jgi:hypothetical protein
LPRRSTRFLRYGAATCLLLSHRRLRYQLTSDGEPKADVFSIQLRLIGPLAGTSRPRFFRDPKNDPAMPDCQGFSCPKVRNRRAPKWASSHVTQKSRSHSDLTHLRAPWCEIAGPSGETLRRSCRKRYHLGGCRSRHQ